MFYQKAKETLYKALPVQVLEGSEGNATSLETQSNPSLQSQLTTSDESDTVRVYDFNKQETTVLKTTTEIQEQAISTTSTRTSTTTASMESALGSVPSDTSSSSASIDASRKRERPVVLQFGPADTVPAVCASPTMSTSRGSTPPAFRFLQPKRRLIEPSQVLSIDEDEVVSRFEVFTRSRKFNSPPLWQIEPSPSPVEKTPIEDEVAHSMPSVKALAQAFLLTSKRTQPERRWRAKVSKIYRSRLTLHILMPDDDAAPQAGRTPRYTRKAKYASVA